MAYIIHGMFGKSQIGYSEADYQVLRAFFDRTDAYPGTITSASWVTGTWIPPEVVPRRVRLTKAKTMYDWMLLLGGGNLVSSRPGTRSRSLTPDGINFSRSLPKTKTASPCPAISSSSMSSGASIRSLKTEAISRRADAATSKTGATHAASGHGNARWMRPSSAAGRAGSNIAMANAGSFPTGWPRC
jgi:hypothetical protein